MYKREIEFYLQEKYDFLYQFHVSCIKNEIMVKIKSIAELCWSLEAPLIYFFLHLN